VSTRKPCYDGTDRDGAQGDRQADRIGQEPDRRRTAEQAGVADCRGERDARCSPEQSGSGDGEREDVGQAEPDDHETTEGDPQRRRRDGGERAQSGEQRAADQQLSLAPGDEHPAAEQPAERHGEGEPGVTGGRQRLGSGELLAQQQRTPVGQGTLAEGRTAGDGPEDHEHRRGAAAAPRPVLRPVRLDVAAASAQQGGEHPGAHEQAGGGDQREVRGDAEQRRRGASDQRAGEPAEAEPGVQAGEDRPADPGLHLHPHGIRCHVDHAGRRAEEEQRDAEGEDRRHQPRQHGPGGDRDRGGRGHRARAEPGRQGAGGAHRGEGTERQAQQRDAELAVGGADLGGDVGHAGGPAAEDGPVEQEEGGDCRPQPGDRRSRYAAAGSTQQPGYRDAGTRQRGRS